MLIVPVQPFQFSSIIIGLVPPFVKEMVNPLEVFLIHPAHPFQGIISGGPFPAILGFDPVDIMNRSVWNRSGVVLYDKLHVPFTTIIPPFIVTYPV